MNHFKKIIINLSVTILILCTALSVTAYAAETKTPSGIEYSELEDRITRYIEEYKDTTASVSLAIFNGQNTLYQTHYGYTDIENNSLANDDTVYEWGSVSKLLVWISVMQLWEQGKIDLDANIAMYLPDGFLTKLNYETPITMLNLMNHNAGWQETTFDVETGDVNRIVGLADALKQSEPQQIYEPGTVCAYSNWGCSLAGYIVERISGQSFYEYVQENIFEPLGMAHTALAPDLSDNTWVQEQRQSLNCYYIDDENYEDLGTCIRHILLYPSGMATGTLDDFLTFAKALMPSDNEASPLFKNIGTLDTMLIPTSFYGDTDIPRICHGMWTMEFGVSTVGHGGNTSGCSSYLLLDIESGTGVVIMTNQVAEVVYNNGLMALVFGEFTSAKDEPLPSAQKLSGIYTSSRTFKKGMFKIYNVTGSLLPLSKTSDKNVLAVSIADGSLTQVAPHQYIFDMSGAKYFVYANITDDGSVSLQMMSQDFIKENTAVFALKVIFILLAVIGVIYSIIMVFVKLLVFVIRKIRRRSHTPILITKCHVITLIATVLFGINIMGIYNTETITLGTMWWRGVLNGVFALIPMVYTIILTIKFSRIDCTKRQKFGYILTTVFGLVVTLNILYWELYDFWGV